MAEVKSVDTRERILDVAERLFMGHGYDGTSMRMITSEAAVNLAAVNYHFGSKESLMQEVFRRRLDWLNEERMRVLDDTLEREAAGKALKAVVRLSMAFSARLLRMAGRRETGRDDIFALARPHADRSFGVYPHLSGP
jgi:AcrR family transcriptional regulator